MSVPSLIGVELMFVPLKANSPWAGLPTRATPKSFGYDLITTQEEIVPARSIHIVNTHLQLAVDLKTHLTVQNGDGGIAMLIIPRSSLPIKYGLIVANSPGLIDADYTGEIGVILYNLTDKDVKLELGWKIAQAVFVELLTPNVIEVSTADTNRVQRGGFGSTGR